MDSFDDSMVIPQNLRFYLHRLAENSQPSLQVLKINPMNSTSAASSSMVTVRLPMALVDMNSFAMHFGTSVTNGTGAAGVLPGILPKGIESLISRLEISANGMSLLNLQNYGLLYNVLKDSHQGLDKSMTRRVLQNECDTSVLLEASTGNSTVGSGQTVHVQSVTAIAGSGTAATIDCVCSALYPNIAEGVVGTENAGPINLAALGITYATFTGAFISGVKSVPAYTQTINSQVIYGPLVTKFTYNIVGTTIVTSGAVAVPTTDPAKSFSVYVNSATAAGTALAAVTVPFSGLVAPQAGVAPYYVANQNNFHTISDWLSVFKCSPEFIQLQAIGELEIRITLYDNSVLSVPPDAGLITRPDFSLQNIYFTIRTCSFDTDIYDSILSEKLASGGEIEIPYPNYFNISQTQSAGSSSTRFSINTQCLEKVVAVNRPSYYNTLAGATMAVPTGYGITSTGTVGLVSKGAFFSTYAGGGALPFTGGAVSQPNTWQMQINNSFVPNLPIQPETSYFFNLEGYDMHNDWLSSTIAGNPALYLASSYQMLVALDFMDAETKHALFGVDTRGAVSVAYVLQNNNNGGDRTDIFTCFKSVLRVAANQQLQVIY